MYLFSQNINKSSFFWVHQGINPRLDRQALRQIFKEPSNLFTIVNLTSDIH